MKNAILIFCLAVFGMGVQSQDHEFNRLYTSFRGEEGVIRIYVPGFLCHLAGSIADLEPEERELLRSIKSIKVLVIENPEINRQVNVARVISRAERDPDILPLLQVHEDDEDVLIMARQQNECISELWVLVGGDENVMIKIRGRMDHDLIQSLYKVTGIEQVKYTRQI